MIYLICGKNTYLSKKKKQELIEAYKKKGFVSEFLDKDYTDIKQFLEEFRSQSLFGEKKLFIIDSLWEKKSLKEKIQKEIEKLQNQEIIVFENKEISSKDKLFKEIQKIGKVFQFSLLGKREIKKIIRDDLKKENFYIEDIALDTLIEFLNSHPERFPSELAKLKAYKFFEKKIETQDVLKLINKKKIFFTGFWEGRQILFIPYFANSSLYLLKSLCLLIFFTKCVFFSFITFFASSIRAVDKSAKSG